jgi:uncharacterized protein YjiS (DUF1127 family)
MSTHSAQGWTLTPHENAPGESVARQSDSSSGWLHTLFSWIDRSRQRRALGELADLNNYLLEDIGVSKEQALHESAKPFWQ